MKTLLALLILALVACQPTPDTQLTPTFTDSAPPTITYTPSPTLDPTPTQETGFRDVHQTDAYAQFDYVAFVLQATVCKTSSRYTTGTKFVFRCWIKDGTEYVTPEDENISWDTDEDDVFEDHHLFWMELQLEESESE